MNELLVSVAMRTTDHSLSASLSLNGFEIFYHRHHHHQQPFTTIFGSVRTTDLRPSLRIVASDTPDSLSLFLLSFRLQAFLPACLPDIAIAIARTVTSIFITRKSFMLSSRERHFRLFVASIIIYVITGGRVPDWSFLRYIQSLKMTDKVIVCCYTFSFFL